MHNIHVIVIDTVGERNKFIRETQAVKHPKYVKQMNYYFFCLLACFILGQVTEDKTSSNQIQATETTKSVTLLLISVHFLCLA